MQYNIDNIGWGVQAEKSVKNPQSFAVYDNDSRIKVEA